MGLLDAVAGAVRGGAGAVGDIADSEIKTNQAMRLQQQHGDIQGQLNSQLSDLNVSAAQKIADYQRSLQTQDRTRRAGYATYTNGAPGDNEAPELDMGATADKAIAAGEGDYGDSLLGAQTKTEKVAPYGGVVMDRHGRVLYDNSIGRTLKDAARANGDPAKNTQIAENLFKNGFGNRTFGVDPSTMKPAEDMGLITAAHGAYTQLLDQDGGNFNPARHLAEISRLEQTYVPAAEKQALIDTQKKFGAGTDPDKDPNAMVYFTKQRATHLRAAFTAFAAGGGAGGPPVAAPKAPPSAGPAGQPQRDAAAASAAPTADSAAQSDTARMNSAAGLLSSARAAPTQPVASSPQDTQMAARAKKEKYEILSAARRDYSPEVQAWIDAQEKALVKTSQAARGRALASTASTPAVSSGD